MHAPGRLNPPVVVVDDELPALRAAATALKACGIDQVVCLQDGRALLPLLEGGEVRAVLLDLNMPGPSGESLLTRIVQEHPHVPVVIVTAVNDVRKAVECIRAGACDYLVKPVEKDQLASVVRRACELAELRCENTSLRRRVLSDEIECPLAFAAMVTVSRRMHKVFQYVEAIARSARPILIAGETGVGKELVARAAHTLSGRAGALVAVNVAGLDDNVFSDTLFGHVRGAFTGADTPRPGMIEQAAGGTLLLDEMADLSAASQVKLLRLLQEGEYLPLGADLPRRSDARIIATTHENLHERCAGGQFRKDLYYRLGTHQVEVPPLRERPEDLPVLVQHFVQQAAAQLDRRPPGVEPGLLRVLATYPFPGNVRELESFIFDAVGHVQDGTLSGATFADHCRRQPGGGPGVPAAAPVAAAGQAVVYGDRLPTIRESLEGLITEALRRADGNQSVAARQLGISAPALSRRLKRARCLSATD